MTAAEVLAALEAAGSEQTRKTYRRHGVRGDLFGVKYGDLERVRKQIKRNQALAVELWASGNHDARVLATKVADPAGTEAALLDAWVRDLDSYPIADAFAEFAAATPVARAKADEWAASPDEWTGRAGWLVIARLAGGRNDIPDGYFERCLETIEREIHQRKNYTRDAMNSALIAIGLRSDALRDAALAAAARIGTVTVDHGETNCTTPDAVAYIEKAVAHRGRKARAGAA